MAAVRSILIVEDNAAFRSILAEQLAGTGEFTADEAGTAAAAEQLLADENTHYDVILLDVGLPDADGREFCAKLRRNGLRIPIIMLTGAGAEQDVVNGLNAGANDYIAKPLRFPELLARVRAQLRIFDNSENPSFILGPYLYRPSAKSLLEPIHNKQTILTETENKLLLFLWRRGGKPATRRILLSEVWGQKSEGDTHTLQTHIYRLRQKIEVDPSNPRLLVVDGGSYRLNFET